MRITALVVVSLGILFGAASAACGQGVGGDANETYHTVSLMTFMPEEPILWGTIIGRDNPIRVELDPNGPVWTKHFEMDGPVLPMAGGSNFGIKERLTIAGSRPWTGWEMLIPPVGVEVIFDRPHIALSGTTSVLVNGQAVPGLDISLMMTDPLEGTWLRYSFDPLPPGTQADIIMRGLYTGQAPLEQPFTISQFPTPEPSTALMLLLGGVAVLRRHRTALPLALVGLLACPVFSASPKARQPLENAQIVQIKDSQPDAQGVLHRQKVVRTTGRYPLVRIQQEVKRDQTTGDEEVIESREMVADHIIVKIREGKNRADLNALNARFGYRIRGVVHIPDAFLVELNDHGPEAVPQALSLYAKEANVVAYAEPDGLLYLTQQCTRIVPNDPGFTAQWGMDNSGQQSGTPDADIDAPEAWCIATGASSVLVGVIDTGIDYNHPDLAANIWTNPVDTAGDANGDGCPGVCGVDDDGDGLVDEDSQGRQPGEPGYSNDLVNDDDENGYPDDIHGWDFLNNDNDPLDDWYHGTHVAGTIGAVGNNGDVVDNGKVDGVAGVCWNARIVPIKTLEPTDEATYASVTTKAIDYATSLGVFVTNNSYRSYVAHATMFDAISRADQRGILFVAAAGNETRDNDGYSPAYPASFALPNIISVAALTRQDGLAGFSNYGRQSVDLGAPGYEILSTFPTYMTPAMSYYGFSTDYEIINGTSMAAPHVSGACALLKSVAPSLSYAEIKARLLGSVDPIPALEGKVLSGGRLNLFKLLDTTQDTDGDGIDNWSDNCPTNHNPGQEDGDTDGVGDVCDNCPTDANPGQENCDGDAQGNDCDSDDDNDGVPDASDNCDCDANPDQADCDGDDIGNVCDATPGSLMDFDGDCDVDQADFAHIQACLSDGVNPLAAECMDAWMSGSKLYLGWPHNEWMPAVTDADIKLFECCASSPGVPVGSTCGDADNDGIHDAHLDLNHDGEPDCDSDHDGIALRGRRMVCTGGNMEYCDDNCQCVANDTQADSDADGIGDACDPTPNGLPPREPASDPPAFGIAGCRSVRWHGSAGKLSVDLDPLADAANATIEPRQGFEQIIEVDLSQAAHPVLSALWQIEVLNGEGTPVLVGDSTFSEDYQTVIITFYNDPEFPEYALLDQNCYTIDLSAAIKDSNGNAPTTGDADCAIRMLAGDVDGDAVVEQADDVDAIAAANGQTVGASNARLDVNVDGIIDTADSGIASGLLDNTVVCSGSGMMMAMGWANEGVGPTSGADALVGTFALELSRKGQGAVSAAMVLHETGATSVTLPAAGGTIGVDVVISTAARIWGFEGRPAVDAANVVSIDAANWTELDNVMMSHGQPSAALSSYYDLTVMDWVWFAAGPNGEEIMGSDIEPLLSEEPPLTSSGDVKGPPVVMTLVDDLSALDGPISTPAGQPLPESVVGQWFTTSAVLGGATRTPTGPGQTVVATLSLTVSGTPGTYHLTLADARFVNVAYLAVPMSAVQPLDIVVQGH